MLAAQLWHQQTKLMANNSSLYYGTSSVHQSVEFASNGTWNRLGDLGEYYSFVFRMLLFIFVAILSVSKRLDSSRCWSCRHQWIRSCSSVETSRSIPDKL